MLLKTVLPIKKSYNAVVRSWYPYTTERL